MSAQVINSGGGGASAKFKANNRSATMSPTSAGVFIGTMFPITNPSLNEEKAILTMTTEGEGSPGPILNSFYDNGDVKHSYIQQNGVHPNNGMICIRYNEYMIYAKMPFIRQDNGSAKFDYYIVNIANGAVSAQKTATASGLTRYVTSGSYWDYCQNNTTAAYSYVGDQGAVIDKWGRVLIPFCFSNSTTDPNYSYRGWSFRYIMAISNITTNPTAVLWQVGRDSNYFRSVYTPMYLGYSTLYMYDVDDNTQCVVLSYYGDTTSGGLDKPLYNYITKLYITSSGLSRYEDTLVTDLPFTTLYHGTKNTIRYYENGSVYELNAPSANSLGDYVLLNKIPIDETTMLPNVNLKTALGCLSLKGRCMRSPTKVTGYGYSQPSVISIHDEKEILIDYPYYRIEPLSLSKFETV